MRLKVGVIGGTGLDEPNILQNPHSFEVSTPWGPPSDRLISGQIHGVDVVLLARHGRHHTIHPGLVNYRANIWALKAAGCTHVIVTNAVGSLQEDIEPGHFVLLDQFVDRTTGRDQTFHDGSGLPGTLPGICHIPMAYPFCPETRQVLLKVSEEMGLTEKNKMHPTGTIVVIEGPRYSTKAESKLYRSWGCHVVGMTSVPEVVLANELGMSYASVALVTDTDCWKDTEHVTAELVVERFKQFAKTMVEFLHRAIEKMKDYDWEPTYRMRQEMLRNAIMIPKEQEKDHPFINPIPDASVSLSGQKKE